MPDDVSLANHDWKNGLLHLFALLVFATVITVVRNAVS